MMNEFIRITRGLWEFKGVYIDGFGARYTLPGWKGRYGIGDWGSTFFDFFPIFFPILFSFCFVILMNMD